MSKGREVSGIKPRGFLRYILYKGLGVLNIGLGGRVAYKGRIGGYLGGYMGFH